MTDCYLYRELTTPGGVPYRRHETGCRVIDRLLNDVRQQLITEQVQLAMEDLDDYDPAAP